MSDILNVNFHSLIVQRVELRNNLKISGFTDKLALLSQFLIACDTLAKNSDKIDSMLIILKQSAVKNNDFEALGKIEIISREILETIK